jgi:hypothetical protein
MKNNKVFLEKLLRVRNIVLFFVCLLKNRFRQQLALNETSLEDLEGKVDKMLKVCKYFLSQNVEFNCVNYTSSVFLISMTCLHSE